MKSRKQLYLESLRTGNEIMLSHATVVACDSNIRFEMGWLDRVVKRSEQESPYSPSAAIGRTVARGISKVAPYAARATVPGQLYHLYKAIKDRIYKRKSNGQFTADLNDVTSRSERHVLMSQGAKMGLVDSLLKLTGGRHEDEHGRSLTGGYRVRDTPENRAITEKHGADKIGGIGERSRAAPKKNLVNHLTGGTRLHRAATRQYQRDNEGQFASHDVEMGLFDRFRRKDPNREWSQEELDKEHAKNVKHHMKKGAKHIATYRHKKTGILTTEIFHPQHGNLTLITGNNIRPGGNTRSAWFQGHSGNKFSPRKYERDSSGKFAGFELGLGDAVRALTDHYFRSSGNRFRSDEGDPPLSGKNKIAVKDVIAHHKAKEAEHAAKLKTYSVKDPLPGTRKYAAKHKAERNRHAAVRTHYEALQRAGKTHVSQRQYDRDSSGRFA